MSGECEKCSEHCLECKCIEKVKMINHGGYMMADLTVEKINEIINLVNLLKIKIDTYDSINKEWIRIEERRPPNDVAVLLAVYDGRAKVKMYHPEIGRRINDTYIDNIDGDMIDSKYGIVTHWRWLPDLPIVDK